MGEKELNAVYTSAAMKRRYEVWFMRFGLTDGSGAWWFRYLVMNLGRVNAGAEVTGMPAQVWATWFPRNGEPRSFIQGFPLDKLSLSRRKAIPFHCRIAENGIEEGRCWGKLDVDGHNLSWNLRINSKFGFVLSNKGWIGFSKSPHSDATFSGQFNSMECCSAENRWDLASKGTIAAIGTARIGDGCTPTSPKAATGRRIRWRLWSMICRWA